MQMALAMATHWRSPAVPPSRLLALAFVVVLHLLFLKILDQGDSPASKLAPPVARVWLMLLPEPMPKAMPSSTTATAKAPERTAARTTSRTDTIGRQVPTAPHPATMLQATPESIDLLATPPASEPSPPTDRPRPLDLTPHHSGPRARLEAPPLSPAAQAVEATRPNPAPTGVFDRALGSAQRTEERIDDDRFRVHDRKGCTEYHRPAADNLDPFNTTGQKRPWLAQRC